MNLKTSFKTSDYRFTSLTNDQLKLSPPVIFYFNFILHIHSRSSATPFSTALNRRGQCTGLSGDAALCGEGPRRTLRGSDEEEGRVYCLLMRPFDVAPLFAVCTPGSLRLHSDWLSPGRGWGVGGRPGIFQVTLSSQLVLLPGVGRQ